MRIVDAVWEKRNLGVEVQEVTCDFTDSTESIGNILRKTSVPYSVVKIPVGCTELLFESQKNGYSFIEMSIQVEIATKNINLPSPYKRFLDVVTIKTADEKMKNKVLQEICAGEIFATDRIAIDPHFSKELAGRRYYHWSMDELQHGAEIVIAYYKEEPVAFGINKCVEGTVFDAFLGGVFPEAANKGLGFLAVYANMESIRKKGGTKMITRVSSNNPPILKIYMQLGYAIKEMCYVLIKHQG